MAKEASVTEEVAKLRKHFFVPAEPDSLFALIDKRIEILDSNYLNLAQSFRHNLNAAVAVVSVRLHWRLLVCTRNTHNDS